MSQVKNEFAIEMDEEFYKEYSKAYSDLKEELEEHGKLFAKQEQERYQSLKYEILVLKNATKLLGQQMDEQIKRAEELVKNSKTQNEDTFPTLTTKY